MVGNNRVEEEEIEMQTEALRKKLLEGSPGGDKVPGRRQYKSHQVHEIAAAKIEESEKLRKALGYGRIMKREVIGRSRRRG